MRACVEAAADDAAKKACFKDSALKDKIAGLQEMDKSSVKDSRVRDYAMKGTRDDILAAISSCNKTADKATCKDIMKELKSKSMMGKTKDQITDDDLKFDARQALKG